MLLNRILMRFRGYSEICIHSLGSSSSNFPYLAGGLNMHTSSPLSRRYPFPNPPTPASLNTDNLTRLLMPTDRPVFKYLQRSKHICCLTVTCKVSCSGTNLLRVPALGHLEGEEEGLNHPLMFCLCFLYIGSLYP